jgi:septum formation protein
VSEALHHFVWLASQSPRRRQLLDQLGVQHRLLLADADEDAEALEATRAGETPADYVTRVTRAKLAAARTRLARRNLAPTPRWRSARASSASRWTTTMRVRCC